jgi:hypothetical protein
LVVKAKPPNMTAPTNQESPALLYVNFNLTSPIHEIELKVQPKRLYFVDDTHCVHVHVHTKMFIKKKTKYDCWKNILYNSMQFENT